MQYRNAARATGLLILVATTGTAHAQSQSGYDYTQALVGQYNALRRDHPEIVAANRQKVVGTIANASAARLALAKSDDQNFNMNTMMARAAGGLNVNAGFGRISGENGNPFMSQGNLSPAAFVNYGKGISNSPRPCASGIQAPIACSSGSSFPSGHTGKGTGAALLAAYMAPEKFQAFITRAQEYGESRIVVGQHYPLDVMASRAITYKAVADQLARQVPDPQSWLNTTANVSATRAALFSGCGSMTPMACATSRTDAFSDHAANKAYYDYTTNYGFASVAAKGQPMVVPENAEWLIASRFNYLDADQRREIIRTTAYDSGRVLDDPWSRINLFAAADGYGSFASQVVVNQNAGRGGYATADTWMNDISGAGGLTHNGTGMLTLTGNNSYAGGTILNGGVLAAGSATAFGTGDMTINGGTLMVDGQHLVIGGNLTLGSLGTLGFGHFLGTPMLDVAGSASLDGLLTIDAAGWNKAGTYDLMAYGSRTGIFSGFDLANLGDGLTGSLLYGEHGLSLSIGAVPEPQTWAMMVAGFGLLGGTLRRRRAVSSLASA